jgi:acetone carboxylase, alpha subunit
VRNTDLFEKMSRGDVDLPKNAVELVTERTIRGEYVFENINRPTRVGVNGDVVVQFAAGGAGYGDVLQRDPATVVADVRAGLVSRWVAENVYCVRFDPESFLVEEALTKRYAKPSADGVWLVRSLGRSSKRSGRSSDPTRRR